MVRRPSNWPTDKHTHWITRQINWKGGCCFFIWFLDCLPSGSNCCLIHWLHHWFLNDWLITCFHPSCIASCIMNWLMASNCGNLHLLPWFFFMISVLECLACLLFAFKNSFNGSLVDWMMAVLFLVLLFFFCVFCSFFVSGYHLLPICNLIDVESFQQSCWCGEFSNFAGAVGTFTALHALRGILLCLFCLPWHWCCGQDNLFGVSYLHKDRHLKHWKW